MTSSRRAEDNRGFTLVELLVSMVVLTIMLVLLTQLTNSLRSVISHTTSSIDAFKEARDAFETMTRRIAQATLNSYDDLNPAATASHVVRPGFRTALHLRRRGHPHRGKFLPRLPVPDGRDLFPGAARILGARRTRA